ncbi:transposase [Bacteroidota bacterium]
MKQEPFESGKYYHIFNRGNNKENIFIEDENYNYLLKLIKKYLTETCIIYAYCLLPNHFHLLLKIKEMENLPDLFQNGKKKIHQPISDMFNAYSKAINKKYKRTGSLFQKHMHRINIASEEYFRELILYIHLNPEKHGIFDDFCKYQYSSYKDLTGFKNLLGMVLKNEKWNSNKNYR